MQQTCNFLSKTERYKLANVRFIFIIYIFTRISKHKYELKRIRKF